MALVLIVTSVVLIALAVYMAVVAIGEPSERLLQTLGQIGAYGYASVDDERVARGRTLRDGLDGIAMYLGGAAAKRLTGFQQSQIQRELLSAGLFHLSVRKFLGYRLILAVALPVALLWMLSNIGSSPTLVIAGFGLGIIAGWSLPMTIVRRRARARLQEIEVALPELIDLLVVTLEAGASFSAALRIASERIVGPLGQEVRLTIQEQALGLTNLVSLENWLKRCDTPSVRSFVRAMVQGDRLGVSISHILRNQAIEMRARRKSAIEEKAQRAPTKILFPLVLLIFPALFVIILGPAAISVMSGGGGI